MIVRVKVFKLIVPTYTWGLQVLTRQVPYGMHVIGKCCYHPVKPRGSRQDQFITDAYNNNETPETNISILIVKLINSNSASF